MLLCRELLTVVKIILPATENFKLCVYQSECFKLMDDSLKDKIAKHNPEAIQQFVGQYKDRVFRTCMGYVHDYTAAQDLSQEVFIKAINAMDSFRGKSSVATWLTRIAMNLSLNYLRDTRKFLKNTDIERAFHLDAGLDSQANSGIENNEIGAALQQAMGELPERQKDVFVLFHYNEHSYAEIADTMQLTVSAVESLLQRARKNLQGKLKNYYQANFS